MTGYARHSGSGNRWEGNASPRTRGLPDKPSRLGWRARGAPARSVKSGQLSTRFFRDSMVGVTWSSADRSSSTVASSPRLRSTGSVSGKVFSHPSSSPRVTPAFWRVASCVVSSAALKERNVPSGKKKPVRHSKRPPFSRHGGRKREVLPGKGAGSAKDYI